MAHAKETRKPAHIVFNGTLLPDRLGMNSVIPKNQKTDHLHYYDVRAKLIRPPICRVDQMNSERRISGTMEHSAKERN